MIKFNYIVLTILSYQLTNALNCGDWDAYKDVKCLLVFDNNMVLNYTESEKLCHQIGGSSLMAINSQEENDFIYNLLSNVYKIVNDVWVETPDANKVMLWVNRKMNYTNWGLNNPHNWTGYQCIKMRLNETFNGKWMDEACALQNSIVCQKTD